MFRKLAIALAATVALGTAALTVSTPAQAWGSKHHHHSFFGFRAFAPAFVVAPGCYVKRYVMTPAGLERRLINVCY